MWPDRFVSGGNGPGDEGEYVQTMERNSKDCCMHRRSKFKADNSKRHICYSESGKESAGSMMQEVWLEENLE